MSRGVVVAAGVVVNFLLAWACIFGSVSTTGIVKPHYAPGVIINEVRVWCGAVRCGAVWCGAMRCHVMRCCCCALLSCAELGLCCVVFFFSLFVVILMWCVFAAAEKKKLDSCKSYP